MLAHALDVLFILHADHEQNCSTTAMRVVGSSHSDPYSATAAAAAALYGPRHGGANEAVIRMLTDIGSIDNVPEFINTVKGGHGGQRLQGFGHRVYKSYDPRAKIVKQIAYEVFEVTGKNPLLDIALKLEEIALSDEYFTSRHLYPNVDFYSGPDLPGHGLPDGDVHRPLLHPPHRRVAGALAGDAGPGLEDRPAPPALHRIGAEGLHPDHRALGGSIRRARPSWTIETHNVPGPFEQEAPGQAAAGRGHRRIGVIEQPFVGPERAVEPHAVVEAGAHEVGVVPAHVVGGQDGVEERHVRGVGRDGGVQQRVVGQVAVGPEPQPLVGLAGPLAMPEELTDVALVDRMRPVEPVDQLLPEGLRGARRGWAATRDRGPRAWGAGAPGPPRGRGTTPTC